MSKDFGGALKDNGVVYGRKHLALRDVALFNRAKRGLLLVRDCPVTDEDVVVAGCELLVADCEAVMRRKLEEAGKNDFA